MRQRIVIKPIHSLPVGERPRERLLASGPAHLSDSELLAILIGCGTKGTPLGQIAAEVVALLDRQVDSIQLRDLMAIRGMGATKATQIAAALEFARRRLCPGSKKISYPADVVPIIAHYADRSQEHFLCLSLNGAHEVMSLRVVSIGLLNRTIVHPREVFADPLKERAAAVIVAHNHPSGSVEPSAEDREVTRRLKEAGETLGIELLDHIVFSTRGYYSFLEHSEI